MASPTCPRCRAPIQIGQHFCAHCSLPLDPVSLAAYQIPGIALQDAGPARPIRRGVSGWAAAGIIIGSVSLFLCLGVAFLNALAGPTHLSPPTPPTATRVVGVAILPPHPTTAPPVAAATVRPPAQPTATEPLEYQLAVINAGGYVAHDDVTVTRFRFLLTNIAQGTGATRQQVADTAVNGQEILHTQYGKSTTLLELMEAENQTVEQSPTPMRLDELVAALVTLIGRQ